MKKTIAILLVLVLAVAGLFAALTVVNNADATLKLTTTVTAINYLTVADAKIVPPEAGEATNLSDWTGFTGVPVATVGVVSGENLAVAYLNLYTNSRTGVNVYVKATKLKSVTNSTTNLYAIDYTLSCNNGAFDTSTDTTNQLIISDTESAAATRLFMKGYDIDAEIDETSFLNAPTDNYQATVTFTFSAS